MTLYIGVDAGGTRCRASLYDADGMLISTGIAGAANVFSHFQQAMLHIDSAIDEAISKSALKLDKNDLIVGAGCAGGHTQQAEKALKSYVHPYKCFFMTSDLHASCIAANQGEDCVIIITGTGSSIASYHDGVVRQYGGYGFMHGDQASGAWLGLCAVQYVLKHFDNLVQDGVFSAAICRALKLGIDTQTFFYDKVLSTSNDLAENASASMENQSDLILEHFKLKQASQYAELAPVIFELKEQGNPTAIAMVNEGVDYLYSVLIANNLKSTLPIYITGGLAKDYQRILAHKLDQELMIMQQAAQSGAMIYAKSEYTKNGL